ncbi:MAG: polyphosphate polymerase domain-containing protein [Clostridia bacterium]|nr:polyphosphate polymerase domain-containing protein [Clostridia bacterium]
MQDLERYESKYLLNFKEALLIQKRLEQYIKPDKYSEGTGYRVRSIYFDTIFNRDFYMREESASHRRHIRIRTYPDAMDTISLELKEKNGVTIRKRILPVTRRMTQEMLSGDFRCLKQHKDPFGRMLYREMTLETYRPVVMIEYQRKAYAREENNTRITFDSCIRSKEGNLDLFDPQPFLAPVGHQGEVIMELKYTDFFMSDLKSAVGTRLLRQEAAGKYQRSRMISMSGRNIL